MAEPAAVLAIHADRPRWRSAVLARAPRRLTAVVGAVMTIGFAVVALAAPVLAPADPFAIDGPSLAGPSLAHPMGTDALGRDLLSGVMFGLRTSMVVAAATGVIVAAVGLSVGVTSGLLGGGADGALMRLTELFQVMPRFFLALAVIALFGPGIDRVVVVLGLTSWPLLARVVRSEVLSLREREFVEAARASGASSWRIAWRELLPNVAPTTVAVLGLTVAQAMLIEASLGFVGLGDPEQISLGFLSSQAQRFLRVAWWLSVFPGAAMVAVVLAVNLVGDALVMRGTGARGS